MRVLNLGLGVNSVALGIEATNRGIVFDLIIFTDTGDERVRTYAYRDVFSRWLVDHGQPSITTTRWIRQDGSFVPISSLSLKRKELPSKAYGYSGCTVKWKQQPADKFVAETPLAKATWERGGLVERWIGYDADEPARAERMLAKDPQPTRRLPIYTHYDWRRFCTAPDTLTHHGLGLAKNLVIAALKEARANRRANAAVVPYGANSATHPMLPTKPLETRTARILSWKWRCPLVEWDMGREECLAIIKRAGLASPGKSSCFMCPSMKKHEIDTLAREEPEMLARALEIEDAARASGELRSVIGLGRSFAWRDYLEGKAAALAAREVVEQECGCFDGEDDAPASPASNLGSPK